MHFVSKIPGDNLYEVQAALPLNDGLMIHEKIWPATPRGVGWAEAAAVCSWLNGGAKPDFIF